MGSNVKIIYPGELKENYLKQLKEIVKQYDQLFLVQKIANIIYYRGDENEK